MNVRKTIKKIVAVGAGMTMVGATIMGAMAASLSDYPMPFVSDGEADVRIVVGENAATADVLGAIDIAASLQAAAKKATSVECPGTVSVVGGKTEDIPVGTDFTDTTDAFGTTVDEDDVASMLDTTITIDIGDDEDDYDVSDSITFTSGISVQTGLTYANNQDEDWKDRVFIPIETGAIGYNYNFDDALGAGNFLNDSTTDDPIEIEFLGKNLKVVGAPAATQLRVQVGEEVFLQVGDTVEIDGRTVELKNVGSGNSPAAVIVTVDGVSETVTGTETVNNIKIAVQETFYSDALSERSATIIVGDEATKTYTDNDEYIGEDEDDPMWRWDLAGLNTASPTVGILWALNVDDVTEDDNPAIEHPLYEGESVCLPNNYVCIEFNSLKINDYKDYEIDTATKDLYATAASASPTYSSARVLRVRAKGESGKGFVINGTDASEIYYYSSDATGLLTYYDDDTNSKAIYSSAIAGNNFNIDYKDTNLAVTSAWTNASPNSFTLTFAGSATANVVLYVQEGAAGQISYFGHSDGDTTTANDVLYGAADISGWEEDTRTGYGIVIRDPDSHQSGDSFEMSVPSDVTEFKANVVLSGSGSVVSSSESGTSYMVSPIAVGLGVLDKDVAAGASKLISVGGPCVNSVSADLLGLAPGTCGQEAADATGLADGKAVIKFFAARNSALVAGWEAEETLGASYVLADFEDHALSGNEVEVLVPSLSSISVNPVTSE